MNCYNWYANSNCPFGRSFFHKVNICVIFCPHEFLGDASSNCFLLKSLFHKVRKHLWNFLPSWTARILKQNQVPFLLEAFFDKGNICVIFCPHEEMRLQIDSYLVKSLFHKFYTCVVFCHSVLFGSTGCWVFKRGYRIRKIFA